MGRIGRPAARAIVSWSLAAAVIAAGGHASFHAASTRLTVIVSDLRLGVGKDPATGRWHATEDFRWGDAFQAFLRAIDEAGQGAADLILDGDTFELWQSLADDCKHANIRAGCSASEALGRVDHVLEAHSTEVAALAAFAGTRNNRLVLVPGDRDAALLFPEVASRVQAAFAAPAARVNIASTGSWTSEDGAIHAEHGHQIPGDPYRFASWPRPFVQESGGPFLERTWAEQLIQGFYNQFETRYPVLDNIAMDGGGLKYLAAADPTAVAAADMNGMVRFFLSTPAWQQFRLDLDGGDVEAPEWDLAAIHRLGTPFLVESLLTDDRLRIPAAQAEKENRVSWQPSDEELAAICDYRAAVRRARRRLERSLTQSPHLGPPPPECPRTPSTRGSGFEYYWRSRDRRFADHLAAVRRAPVGNAGAAPVRVFVYGHIQLPSSGFVPDRGADAPIVLNAGAWQRTVTPFQLDELMKEKNWSEADLLGQLQPEQLAACHGVVWIDPYTDRPRPRLRFWRGEGRWGNLPRDAAPIATACSGGGPAA